MRVSTRVIQRPALRVEQDRRHPLYLFALTGEELLEIADVARAARDRDGNLIGYQRGAVSRHIKNIAEYLDSEEVLFPNSLILALARVTRFVPTGDLTRRSEFLTPGTITIRDPRNVVAYSPVVRMLEESLKSPMGCLFPYRNVATGELEVEGAREVLFTYWSAVRDTFPEAWGLSPTQSRLMHSAGIRAMGRLMDRVMGAVAQDGRRTAKAVTREVDRIRPFCRWTAGVWEELGGLRWNEIQNVPAHIRMLSKFLVERCYSSAP